MILRILYVEDDPRDADLTVRMLQKTARHVQVEVVSTIEAALNRLNRLTIEPLDLVLTDINLRDGNGLSILTHIREHRLPLAVVVVTGMGDEETAVAALKARADDYVVKSRDYVNRLPIILESALSHYRADEVRRSHPLNVLHAESELHDVESTRRHFAVHADHLRLHAVSTGPEALSLLQSDLVYHVLLLDCHLPGVHALDVLRQLRFTLKRDLPVVLTCREGDEDIALQGLQFGASAYVVKRPGYFYELPLQVEDAYARAELMRREAATQKSEARNRALLNAIPDRMFLFSRDGVYLDYHAKPHELLLPPEQFLGKHLSDVMPPELATQFLQCFEQASDKPSLLEYQLSFPDGNRFYEAAIVTCEGDKLLAIVRDITERRKAEELLRQSEERLRLAQQAARVGSWEWDVATGTAIFSETLWRLLGLEPSNLPITVQRFAEFIHPDDRQAVLRRWEIVLEQGLDYFDEFRIVPRNGPMLWLSSHGHVIRSADGRPERMLGVDIDVTERKLAMESLENALAEVQQLKDRLHQENIYLREEIRVASDFGEIIGQSQSLRKVLRQAEQVAPVDTTVLVLGETGTGKELLARAIHNHSSRRKHPLVKVNCAALPAPLIETELFGHEKGAFTGADTRRLGRFALADGGTLFLDEVGELPLDLQAKLLRVLEEGEFELVGSSRPVKVNVRIIAATNRNLAEAVAKGTFRSDLYYRLSIFPIMMPPLRERPEDIRIIAMHLVDQLSAKFGKQIETIPQSALTTLENYHWPGNVRELRNVIERAVIITQGPKLELTDSFDSLTAPIVFQTPEKQTDSDEEQDPDGETLEQSEYNLIVRTLKKVHWRIEGPGGAAELLDVHASTLRSRMRKLGIARPRFKVAHSDDG